MDLRLHISTIWKNLQVSLWFRPIVMTLLAAALAVATTTVDNYLDLPPIFGIEPENVRLVLSSIATSMLTVVSLIFSMIMVTLTLASQQFSPRILINFARDRTYQYVLGIFIGTFIYSLLVLGRISSVAETSFIPTLSLIITTLLALISVGALIHFIDHTAKIVRVNYIIAGINAQTVSTLHKMFSRRPAVERQTDFDGFDPSLPTGDRAPVVASKPGYLQAIDFEELVEIAHKHDLVIQIVPMIGDFIVERSILLYVQPPGELSEDLAEWLQSTFEIGIERTMFDDVLLGIRQLVDIALKAISPAINDPTTAASCVDYLSNILIQATQYTDPWPQRRDDAGMVRVISREVTFAAMVDMAFNQIRYYARSESTVTLRLLRALEAIALATTDQQRHDILWRHAAMISRSADLGITEPVDRQKINDQLQSLARQLGKHANAILISVDETRLNA